MTKRQEYNECCTEIFSTKVWEVENNWREYQKFLANQQILKRTPKHPNFLLYAQRGLVDVFKEKHQAKYLPQYLADFDKYVSIYRDMWNLGFGVDDKHTRPYIFEFDMYCIGRLSKRELTKHFYNDHPDMAEADALFAACVEMYARGRIKNEAMENRLRVLTHDFDIEVVANLPYMVKIMDRLEYGM